jgi:hypothetical protein
MGLKIATPHAQFFGETSEPIVLAKPQECIRALGIARVWASTGAVLLWLIAARLRDFS